MSLQPALALETPPLGGEKQPNPEELAGADALATLAEYGEDPASSSPEAVKKEPRAERHAPAVRRAPVAAQPPEGSAAWDPYLVYDFHQDNQAVGVVGNLGGSKLWGAAEGQPWAKDKDPAYNKVLVYSSEHDSDPVTLDLGKTAANKLFVRGAASWMNRNLSANLRNAIGARKAMGLLGLAEGHRVKLKRHPHRGHGPDAFVVQLDGDPTPLPEVAEKKPAGVPGGGLPPSSEEAAPRRKRGRPPKLAEGAGPDTLQEPAAKRERPSSELIIELNRLIRLMPGGEFDELTKKEMAPLKEIEDTIAKGKAQEARLKDDILALQNDLLALQNMIAAKMSEQAKEEEKLVPIMRRKVQAMEFLAAQRQQEQQASAPSCGPGQQPATSGAAPKVTCAQVMQLHTAAFADPPTARRLYDDPLVDISLRMLLARAVGAGLPGQASLADEFLQSMATRDTGSPSDVAVQAATVMRQFQLAQLFTKLNVRKEKVQAIFGEREMPEAFNMIGIL